MDSRDSLDQTLDSIDLTISLIKHINTQRQMQKINEDTSNNDTDETITFDDDKVKKIYRKDTNVQRKRAKTVKTKKGRTTKMYTINIERKKLLKQRRKKALQNAKYRKLAKENFLAALKADHRADKASNDMNDQLIDGSNTYIIIGVENTDNTIIAAENADNPGTDTENTDNDVPNAENTDNAAINADKTTNAATDGKKSDNAAMNNDNIDNVTVSGENTDNTMMSDNNTEDTISGDDNTENTDTGKISTIEVPSPLLYGRKTTDPSKVETSKRCIPIRVKPSEPSIDDPPPDKITTATAKGHTFDPTDVRVYEFFIQGTPNLKDSEGVEEDQLLEIQ